MESTNILVPLNKRGMRSQELAYDVFLIQQHNDQDADDSYGHWFSL